MNLRSTLAAAVGLVAMIATPALGQMTYLSQSRSVSAQHGTAFQTFSAPDFNAFNATASAGGATAGQSSTLAPGSISASMTCFPAGGSPPSSQSSSLDVTFTVAGPASFTLTASGTGTGSLRLTGPGVDVGPSGSDWMGVNIQGVMTAGQYRVQASMCCITNVNFTLTVTGLPFTIDWYTIDAGGATNLVGGPYTVSGTIGQPDATRRGGQLGSVYTMTGGFWSIVLPRCDADFNNDGSVNSQDFFDFLSAFFSASLAADFNRDNVVNSQDFFDYLSQFFAGCS